VVRLAGGGAEYVTGSWSPASYAGRMDQNRFGLGIDRQGVVLVLMVAIIGLALATAVLWMALR
jgi:hypothetical protein